MLQNRFISELPPPSLSQSTNGDICLESTLQELPLYDFAVEPSVIGLNIAQIFEKYPLVPGVIIIETGKFIGVISRRSLLEYLIRPHGLEIFLNEPISVLYSYARTEMLVLPATTLITTAAQQALRRSPELLGEPIVVQLEGQIYRLLDMHQLNIAYWQIRGIETQVRYERTQAQMIQSEKMASLGRLVDGVAHEILDPVGFIWGNLIYVENYSHELTQLLSVYQQYLPQPPREIAQIMEEIELDFVQQDLPRAIASIRAGADRLKKLVTSLQNFCHIDAVYPKPADLHALIDSILLLLKSRISGEIEIIKNYGNLPPVPCYAGQLNQVFMNIITNAVDALINEAVTQEFRKEFSRNENRESDRSQSRKLQIEITTQVLPQEAANLGLGNSRWVSIQIADNGPGMSEAKQQQLSEAFSIEKRAFKETSLGVSYWIVTARHEGSFKWRSQPGVGTQFEILLPLV